MNHDPLRNWFRKLQHFVKLVEYNAHWYNGCRDDW